MCGFVYTTLSQHAPAQGLSWIRGWKTHILAHSLPPLLAQRLGASKPPEASVPFSLLLLNTSNSALSLVARLPSVKPVGLTTQDAFQLPFGGPLPLSAYILVDLPCALSLFHLSLKYLDSPLPAFSFLVACGNLEVPLLSFCPVTSHWHLY